MRCRAIATLVLPLMLTGYVYSQALPGAGSRGMAPPDRPGSIRGNVVMPDGSPVSEAVKVTLKALRGEVAMVYTDQQGRFELANIAPAQYTLEVEADRERRFEITREAVQVLRGGGPTLVTLYLKEKQGPTRTGTDRNDLSRNARSESSSAAKKSFKGQSFYG